MGSLVSSLRRGGGTGEADPLSAEPSRVSSFHSSISWQIHFMISEASSQLMVIDFAASWCPPCKFMEPIVDAMASTFTDVDFAKIDVDELPDVAQEFKVQGMPTFVLVKKGKEVDRVVGAKKDELQEKIKKHRAPLPSSRLCMILSFAFVMCCYAKTFEERSQAKSQVSRRRLDV
ncbi:hypothetical protein F2P56_021308 [Juglans regia]|uniref:Thioredoxin domain-containing protein n=1 Tax=Juglans regia TaxID=51240 RepID=A0A833U5D2_JUGRE|nr:hypothetical protein F2P56_021308 [Juglans regia]